MSKVILFVGDLKLGTELSNRIVQHDHEVVFFNEDNTLENQINSSVNMAILDVDDKEFGTVHYISMIKMLHRQIHMVGFMKHIQKQKHDKLRAAGCDMILTRASMTRNLDTFLDLLK